MTSWPDDAVLGSRLSQVPARFQIENKCTEQPGIGALYTESAILDILAKKYTPGSGCNFNACCTITFGNRSRYGSLDGATSITLTSFSFIGNRSRNDSDNSLTGSLVMNIDGPHNIRT